MMKDPDDVPFTTDRALMCDHCKGEELLVALQTSTLRLAILCPRCKSVTCVLHLTELPTSLMRESKTHQRKRVLDS